MALIHRADLSPSKIDLLAAWLPGNPWYQTAAGELARVASYRFDDPDGEVGVETLLVRAGDGPTFQVPLTYPGAPPPPPPRWLGGARAPALSPAPMCGWWAPRTTPSSAGAGCTTPAVTPSTPPRWPARSSRTPARRSR